MTCCVTDYDKKIRIERASASAAADAHGHVDITADATWETYCESYASVMSKGGREFWKVATVSADVSHVWNCPYSSQLASADPAMRLVHEGVTYEILSVIDIDLAHDTIEIQTRRAVV